MRAEGQRGEEDVVAAAGTGRNLARRIGLLRAK
jgi:hypothetical protein